MVIVNDEESIQIAIKIKDKDIETEGEWKFVKFEEIENICNTKNSIGEFSESKFEIHNKEITNCA